MRAGRSLSRGWPAMGDTPQEQADAFVQANTRSPVVVGSARKATKGGAGAAYKLADGTRHTMGGEAHRLLPEGFPRWRE